MAQAKKRAYIRKTADEQIEEYQNKIKEIRNRQIQKAQKILDKKYVLIGKALVGALRDEHITNKAFTMILSKYIDKTSDLESLREDFNLDEDAIIVKPLRSRGRPKGAGNKIESARTVIANAQAESKEDERETLTLPEKELAEEVKVEAPTVAEEKPKVKAKPKAKTKTKAKAKAKAKVKAKAIEEEEEEVVTDTLEQEVDASLSEPATKIEESDEDYEDEDDSQGNIVDPQLHLDSIDNFARRGRLIDRLRTSGVDTLSHLITKSERDFARIPGINTGTVRTCKAILNEMGLGFKK